MIKGWGEVGGEGDKGVRGVEGKGGGDVGR